MNKKLVVMAVGLVGTAVVGGLALMLAGKAKSTEEDNVVDAEVVAEETEKQ